MRSCYNRIWRVQSSSSRNIKTCSFTSSKVYSYFMVHHRALFLIISFLSLVKAGNSPQSHNLPLQHQQDYHHFPHHPHYCPYGGCNKQFQFLPASPGNTPNCANNGGTQTYCENLDQYPGQLIQYLAERWTYDYNTLLSDESRDDFKPKKEQPTTTPRPKPKPSPPPPRSGYGPPPPPPLPPYQPNYQYGPPPLPVPGPFFPPPGTTAPLPIPNPIYNSINYTQPQGEGYPGRRYPLLPQPTYFPEDDPGFIYSAVIQPELAYNQQQSWWKRYARSDGTSAEDKSRNRRQTTSSNSTTGSTIQLCPTRTQFIMPKAGLNNKGNWMYIVNESDRYTQLVRSEICASDQCNGVCSLPSGFTSRCEQQYVQKRLVALDGSGDRLYTDLFWIPHCCICQITTTGGSSNNNNG